MIYDVAIIGGGASGMCAAISIKQKNSMLKTVVIEGQQRVGKKLITTGNGRCNITNKNINIDRYHGNNTDFTNFALKKYNLNKTEEFFRSLGILLTYDETGKAYPYSLQASSVVDALRFEMAKLGVDVFTDSKATDIQKKSDIYSVIIPDGEIKAKTVIIATGLYSGGEKAGCDGSMLKIMKKLGFKTVKSTPAIVQIKTETDIVKQLKGIKVNGTATLKSNGKTIRAETGEILFCDYGLSGPPILQISREVERLDESLTVSLDIMPEYTFNEIVDLLNERKLLLSSRTLDEFFTGMLNKRLGQVILKKCGYKLTDSVETLNNNGIKKIAVTVKSLDFTVTGTTGFINSQVTAGGLDTSEFDEKTMMSKHKKGLFAIGEILDIDGDCGGFNLQWAWSSAMCASDGVCNILV